MKRKSYSVYTMSLPHYAVLVWHPLFPIEAQFPCELNVTFGVSCVWCARVNFSLYPHKTFPLVTPNSFNFLLRSSGSISVVRLIWYAMKCNADHKKVASAAKDSSTEMILPPYLPAFRVWMFEGHLWNGKSTPHSLQYVLSPSSKYVHFRCGISFSKRKTNSPTTFDSRARMTFFWLLSAIFLQEG